MQASWLKSGVLLLAMVSPAVAQAPPSAWGSHPPDMPAPPPTKQQPTAGTPSGPPPSAVKNPPVVPPPGTPATAAKTAPNTVPANKAFVQRTKATRGKKKSAVKEEPVVTPAPEPPPLTPEQLPAAAPQVSYLNGQLTIQSTNATLSSIFNAVRQLTGAQFEIPPNAGTQRVATRVGPGPVRDVLTALLNGSAFDYIILGNPSTPGGVQRVILTAKSGGAPVPMSNASARPPAPSQAQPEPEESTEEEPETAEAPEQPEPPQSAPVPPPPAQAQQGPGGYPAAPNTPQPMGAGPGPAVPANPNPAAAQQQSGGNQVKTPEEMLKELQRLQQQQQQQAHPQQ